LGITQNASYTIFEISILLRGLEVPGLPNKCFQSLQETADFRAYQVVTRDSGLPKTRDFRACQRQGTAWLARDERLQGLTKTKDFRACQRQETAGLARYKGFQVH
jgi:hypothetical protein